MIDMVWYGMVCTCVSLVGLGASGPEALQSPHDGTGTLQNRPEKKGGWLSKFTKRKNPK